MNSFKTQGKARHIGVTAALSLVISTTLLLTGCSPSNTAPTDTSSSTSSESKVPMATLTEVNVDGTVPFASAALNLSKYGYTETEYFATGTANRYRGAADKGTADATIIDGNHEYTTRVLVRKPSPEKFNGTLIVEWTNVTIGVDADFVFAEAGAEYLRDGYAYAVVSAQKVGIDALKKWSPERYVSLSDNAIDIDPVGGGSVDTMNGRDALSWDIFSGVAAALKDNSAKNAPLSGLDIKTTIATGQSQSASRLTGYYNTIQPLYNIFDGFVLWDRATADLRDDVETPAISIDSEGLDTYFRAAPVFRTGGEWTRQWDIAGSTHGSKYAAAYVDAMFQRDGGMRDVSGTPMTFTDWINPSCAAYPVFSTVPNGQVILAATVAVVDNAQDGTPLPPNVLFVRDSSGNIVRDADGNAQGGLHLSAFAAPTAKLSAFNPDDMKAFPCNVSGSRTPYSPVQMKEKYGSLTDYVSLVTETDRALQKDGYLLKVDVDNNIANAKQATIAK